ncbi:hypothetical protein T439DRAFT_344714 [Meredithblackwellia eburnea MCA 4105]
MSNSFAQPNSDSTLTPSATANNAEWHSQSLNLYLPSHDNDKRYRIIQSPQTCFWLRSNPEFDPQPLEALWFTTNFREEIPQFPPQSQSQVNQPHSPPRQTEAASEPVSREPFGEDASTSSQPSSSSVQTRPDDHLAFEPYPPLNQDQLRHFDVHFRQQGAPSRQSFRHHQVLSPQVEHDESHGGPSSPPPKHDQQQYSQVGDNHYSLLPPHPRRRHSHHFQTQPLPLTQLQHAYTNPHLDISPYPYPQPHPHSRPTTTHTPPEEDLVHNWEKSVAGIDLGGGSGGGGGKLVVEEAFGEPFAMSEKDKERDREREREYVYPPPPTIFPFPPAQGARGGGSQLINTLFTMGEPSGSSSPGKVRRPTLLTQIQDPTTTFTAPGPTIPKSRKQLQRQSMPEAGVELSISGTGRGGSALVMVDAAKGEDDGRRGDKPAHQRRRGGLHAPWSAKVIKRISESVGGARFQGGEQLGLGEENRMRVDEKGAGKGKTKCTVAAPEDVVVPVRERMIVPRTEPRKTLNEKLLTDSPERIPSPAKRGKGDARGAEPDLASQGRGGAGARTRSRALQAEPKGKGKVMTETSGKIKHCGSTKEVVPSRESSEPREGGGDGTVRDSQRSSSSSSETQSDEDEDDYKPAKEGEEEEPETRFRRSTRCSTRVVAAPESKPPAKKGRSTKVAKSHEQADVATSVPSTSTRWRQNSIGTSPKPSIVDGEVSTQSSLASASSSSPASISSTSTHPFASAPLQNQSIHQFTSHSPQMLSTTLPPLIRGNHSTQQIPFSAGHHGDGRRFIEKIFAMLSQPEEFGDVICWDSSQTVVLIAHLEPRLESVLQHQFGHKSFSAFGRQFAVYGFHALTKRRREELLPPSTSSKKARSFRAWEHKNAGAFTGRTTSYDLKFITAIPSKARKEAREKRDVKEQREDDRREAWRSQNGYPEFNSATSATGGRRLSTTSASTNMLPGRGPGGGAGGIVSASSRNSQVPLKRSVTERGWDDDRGEDDAEGEDVEEDGVMNWESLVRDGDEGDE